MNLPIDDSELDYMLTDAFQLPPEANFDAWQRQHHEALACLDPRRMTAIARKRTIIRRVITTAVAATILTCLWLGASYLANRRDSGAAFAGVLEQIQKAKTITWKTTFYSDVISKDRESQWIETETREFAFKAPGLYRDAKVDEDGQIVFESITDYDSRKKLHVNHKTQEAILREMAFADRDRRGPFLWVTAQGDGTVEWIRTDEFEGREVNVFRHTYPEIDRKFRGEYRKMNWTYDFWLDAKTKRLVRVQSPGADIYDPDKETTKINPPGNMEWSRISPFWSVEHDIIFDVELDDALFSLEPPEGYKVIVERRPSVTEQEMIEYLGVVAEYYDRTFPDHVLPRAFTSSEINKLYDKPEIDLTPAEQKFLEKDNYYKLANLNLFPIRHFLRDHTIEGTWRYLGKGVELGDKDRIVCWYKLKSTNTFRVVYGDLSVKDVEPEYLPLSVEP